MNDEAAARESLATVPAPVATAAVELYLRLHRAPELSGAEQRTAGLFAAALASGGLEVTRGVGGHGVVGVLRNGPGPTVLLRAELDALPVREPAGLPYASTATARDADGAEVGVMHACGHDLHLACAAGAAAVLSARREAWQGTVLVVGQPAEETLTGAEAMLRDGLYERFGPGPPDAVLAQHSAPLPAGMTAHPTGAATAASIALRVLVRGRGGHAAAPHLALDPIAAAAAIVLRTQTLVARETGPADPAVVCVGALHAGTSANLIPEQARMDLTLRAASDTTLERLLAAVRRVVAAEGAAAGCPEPPEITVLNRAPANHPHRALADAVLGAHRDLLGPDRVVRWPTSLATEDFGLFGPAGAVLHGLPDVRTAYWMFGVVGKAQWARTPGATAAQKLAALPPNHSPRFRPDPGPAVPGGIRALAVAAASVLCRGGGQ